MPKGSPELTQARREEIITACEQLYQTMSFKEITLKEISEATSMSRPSLYNYFETKEEIFLALLQREYQLWVAELDTLRESRAEMSREELADSLARSLERREQLLKLMSMNHYDMEESSRPQRLAEFKRSYGASLRAVDALVAKFCPEKSETERKAFLYAFFPFIYGIYPYAVVTDKQRQAMEKAGVDYAYPTIRLLCESVSCREAGPSVL